MLITGRYVWLEANGHDVSEHFQWAENKITKQYTSRHIFSFSPFVFIHVVRLVVVVVVAAASKPFRNGNLVKANERYKTRKFDDVCQPSEKIYIL